MKFVRWVALMAVVLVLLAGCAAGYKAVPAEEARAFAEKVEPITTNLLTALSSHDEAGYLRDMDETMRSVSSGDKFEGVYQGIIGKIGRYQSHQLDRVLDKDQFRIVIYKAQFEQDANVVVRVVFDMSKEPPKVSGLWFDSPVLRRK
ncbi:MAG: hypothetical protein ACUVT1_10670 [Anaerolineae bacterium]